MELAVKTSFATFDQTRSDLDLIEGDNSLYRLFAPFVQTDGGRIRLRFIREVDRVKKVHSSARTNKKLIVLFDELFRGTNPADALETSLDVILAFAKMPHIFCIVSTHLEQLPKQLTGQAPVDFYQMGTDITPIGDIQFSYQLKPGINQIHIGRKIAQNRGMLKN